jgi:hypothetical protein
MRNVTKVPNVPETTHPVTMHTDTQTQTRIQAKTKARSRIYLDFLFSSRIQCARCLVT